MACFNRSFEGIRRHRYLLAPASLTKLHLRKRCDQGQDESGTVIPTPRRCLRLKAGVWIGDAGLGQRSRMYPEAALLLFVRSEVQA